MAKLATQNLVISISKVVRNDDSGTLDVITPEMTDAIEAIIADLLQDQSIVVEVVSE